MKPINISFPSARLDFVFVSFNHPFPTPSFILILLRNSTISRDKTGNPLKIWPTLISDSITLTASAIESRGSARRTHTNCAGCALLIEIVVVNEIPLLFAFISEMEFGIQSLAFFFFFL